MSDIRLGVVGAGKLGAIHVRLAKETPNAEFVGLYDLDAERAAHVAGEYGTKAFNSVAELIDSVDACCIVTPTTTHHQIALQCLEAGVHAFIEKPIAATVEEAEEISRLYRKEYYGGQTLTPDDENAGDRAVKRLRQLVRSERLRRKSRTEKPRT